jgi:uncharacterized protein
MEIDLLHFVFLCVGFFIIATLYSSVGFGGGSGYLALLALLIIDFYTIRSIALVSNIVVVSSNCYTFYKKDLFNFKKFLPFVITSIPLSFLGASLRLTEVVFFLILGISLVLAAIALIIQTKLFHYKDLNPKKYPVLFLYVLGGMIGFLAGLVGIGGGIFLAPILLFLRWDKPILIASLVSFFILVNSISGVSGLIVNDTFQVPVLQTLILIVIVFSGGKLGNYLTFKKFNPNRIKLLTALLVLFVGLRIVYEYGFAIF